MRREIMEFVRFLKKEFDGFKETWKAAKAVRKAMKEIFK